MPFSDSDYILMSINELKTVGNDERRTIVPKKWIFQQMYEHGKITWIYEVITKNRGKLKDSVSLIGHFAIFSGV